MEPGGDYWRRAIAELGMSDEELEDAGDGPVVKGDYPNLDRVYAKAWELREAEE